MNQNTDIQHIRSLVDKFYQGATTPAEEQALAEFFGRPDADIPADLLGDAQVVRSLSALAPSEADMAVPADLSDKLADITAGDAPAGFRLKPFILRLSAAAAAACLAWGVATFVSRHDGATTPVDPELTAHAEVHPAPEEAADTVAEAAPALPAIQPVAPAYIAQSKPKAQSKPSAPVATLDDEPDDEYTEITDPEAARQIMESIGLLLASNLSQSDLAMNTVGSSIQSYKEITKTVMQ